MAEKYSYSKAYSTYQALITERSDYESEWRSLVEYLLPGRGNFSGATRPSKRKLTTTKVINTIAEDSLYVLTSGMHGGLTSPSRPWFKLEWSNEDLREFEPLKAWLQQCEDLLHKGLHASNFYSAINSFYVEYAGFGTACMFVGHDTEDDAVPFRFELLTAGDYCYAMGPNNRPTPFFRVVYLTCRQVVEAFGNNVSKELRKKVKENDPSVDSSYVSILECVWHEAYQGMPYRRDFYVLQEAGSSPSRVVDNTDTPLATAGFHEFPYLVARWATIGSDVYGLGPGSRSLPDIKRLQEMEKAFLMATHKAINPPLNAPARMRGKLNTLPGGYNYYSNPQETVNEIYQIRFDYAGVGGAVERVEQRIQRNFFNDIFLTAARDPNATPYKATEVNAREQEKMLRLGPVIERLQFEFLQPLLERCFNIMIRKEMMPMLDPALAEMAGDYSVNLVSPLATAQRGVALQGINSFMAFIGQAAQFDQTIMDNVNVDAAAREYADITGVHLGILRPQEEIDQIRQQRAEAMAVEKQKQEQMMAAQLGSQVNAEQAAAQKTQAEAGRTQLETQQIAQQLGVM